MAHSLRLLTILLAGLSLPVAAQIPYDAQGGPAPSGGPSSPFFPGPSPTLFGGGKGYVPPDAGVPGDADDDVETPTTAIAGGSRRAPTRGRSGRVTSDARPEARATADQARVDPSQYGIQDTWLMWWETNKFDFIRLRRVVDAPVTGQGRVNETADQRQQRLEAMQTRLDGEVLPRLRELAGSKDPNVRAAAVVALAKLGDPLLGEVAPELLDDGSQPVRLAAMLALGLGSSARGAYQLMSIATGNRAGLQLSGRDNLSDQDRGTALLTWAVRGGGTLDMVLADMLESAGDLSDQLLTSACEAAGLSGDPRHIASLTGIARDQRRPDYVRASALTALGRLGDPAVVPTLLAALEDGVDPRRAATVALGLSAHGGMDWVVDRLGQVMAEDRDAATRHFAAISLGRLAGDRSRQLLLEGFIDPDVDMRPWVALGLGLCERAEPRGDIPALIAQRVEAEPNVDTRSAYLVALGLAGGDVAAEVLIGELGSGNQENASHAALALGLTGHPDAGPILRQLLDEAASPVLQRRAALGLGVLGNNSAVPTLVDLIRSTANLDVASYSALGIGFLGDENAVGPLLQTIEREDGEGLATTYAVVAVGQLFDQDRRPALTRLASGDNYLARSNAANQLLLLGF